MSILDSLAKIKEYQKNILYFIDNQENIDENLKNLISKLDDKNIRDNPYEFRSLIHLILKIVKSHHRLPNFFDKIEKLLFQFKEEINKYFTKREIINLTKKNKRILLCFIKEKIIDVDISIAKILIGFHHFFSPEIRSLIDQCIKEKTKINFNQKEIEVILAELAENFEENRKNGENENQICKIIRNDSIDDFIKYIKDTLCKLNSTIKSSSYETNSLLLYRKTTLIEYAMFYGSIKIIKYLMKKKVELVPSLWIYAIHSKNIEMIYFLEENHVEPEDKSYLQIIKESIKCHHNKIAKYLIENHSKSENDDVSRTISLFGLKYHNFEFLNESNLNESFFYQYCKFDYCIFVDLFLQNKDIDINIPVILKTIFLVNKV